MRFPEITLKGTPYEKGLAHGSLCKEQVLCSIRNYSANFKKNVGLTWEDAQALAMTFLPVFKGKYAKELTQVAPDRDVPVRRGAYRMLQLAKRTRQAVRAFRHPSEC